VSGQSWDLAQVNQRENPRGVGFGASRTLGAPYAGRMPRRRPLKVWYALKDYPVEIP